MSRRIYPVPALLALVLALLLAPAWPGHRAATPATAMSHREAPLIAMDPTADNTDVFAFVSPDRPDTVTLIACYIPYEVPSAGPNFPTFGDDVLYKVQIDNDGDAEADITYEFRFTTTQRLPDLLLYGIGPVTSLADPNLNVRQTYTLTRIAPGQAPVVLADQAPVAPINVGPRMFPAYAAVAAQAVVDLPGGGKVFAGPRDDPSFIDAAGLFDLVATGPGRPDGGAGYNVHAIALQLPISQLTRTGRPPSGPADPAAVIGVWASAWRQATTVLAGNGTRTATGPWVQVSRMAAPLVNEAFIPGSLKDKYNASQPQDDIQFLPAISTPAFAPLLRLVLGFPAPPDNRVDLVEVYGTGIPDLTAIGGVSRGGDLLRLNTGIPPSATPHRLGLVGGDRAGFPNGRRPADDVFDITLALVGGWLVGVPGAEQLGDGVDTNDAPFLATFPYLALPWPGDH